MEKQLSQSKFTLDIYDITYAQIIKEPAFIWLSENYNKNIYSTIYSDDNSTHISIQDTNLYAKFRELLGIEDDKTKTVELHFKNNKDRKEFFNVFLNKNLEFGLRKKYGDKPGAFLSSTKEYKKRYQDLKRAGLEGYVRPDIKL